MLAGAGAACGMAVAWGALRLLLALAPPDVPRLDEVRIDVPVLLFAALGRRSSACFTRLIAGPLSAM